jgi:NADH dehydrogenase [ubiquinone] 1 alpha subcomplex assembly factor 6
VKGETTPLDGAAGISAVGELVRRHDHDRYQTVLFAPAVRREGLFALYAFNYEVARVREAVTQPIIGQIRLQWWREVVADAYAGMPPRRHAVALPLSAAIRDYGLGRDLFDRIIDAREGDLADAAPVDLAALEEYAAATSASLVHLALAVLGAHDRQSHAAAREVGIAYALAGLLRAMPSHARSGRRYIPDDMVSRLGIDPGDYAAQRAAPALRAAVMQIAEAARSHLTAARRQAVPPVARPALLPATIADRFLTRLRRAGDNPFAPSLRAPDTMQAWRLAAKVLAGRW